MDPFYFVKLVFSYPTQSIIFRRSKIPIRCVLRTYSGRTASKLDIEFVFVQSIALCIRLKPVRAERNER